MSGHDAAGKTAMAKPPDGKAQRGLSTTTGIVRCERALTW
jgi:hypothetical protein